ncbi:MAG: hypothetical protein SGI84_01405 [Gemmatimonadota bacterium]|nr:hypothetical protein [Gemmatimonadota bacterium]
MSPDWIDLLRALAGAEARFLVVGAHALAVHGVPRGTQDLDLWVEATASNAHRVWEALAEFGAPLTTLGIAPEDFHRPGTVVQLGLPPNRVDILTGIEGIPEFQAAWQERVEHSFGGLSVPFLGRATLVANKRAAGRRKDLADLEALGELPPSP